MNYIVITSINPLTKAVIEFAKLPEWNVVVVGDVKGDKYEHENVNYMSIDDQLSLGFNSIQTTPYNHYSRKNIGYLLAISNNPDMIYDTDDDTIPYENWQAQEFECDKLVVGEKFINSFSLYTNEKVWPRGLDLRYILKSTIHRIEDEFNRVGVWQGVINEDSDFDAIYRLTVNKKIIFDDNINYAIASGCYSPFNTQSTLWNKKFYALLYIPITVDFRFSDIFRGYVAQRIMWDYDYVLGFHKPNTYQERNVHDNFHDFIGELNMYQKVSAMINELDAINLNHKSIEDDLWEVYEHLFNMNFIPQDELVGLKNWILDIKKLMGVDFNL